MTTRWLRVLPGALLVVLGACADRPGFPPEVVARYDGGEVTVDELEQRILQEPPARRMPPPGSETSTADWRRSFARRIVAERTWFESMTEADIAARPGLVDRLEAGYRVLFKSYVRDHELLLGAPVHESEIRRLYDERSSVLRVPESYTVRHVYIRVPEGSPPAAWNAAREQAEEVRALMTAAGADLDALIAEHSDSEDASQGGWIRRLRLGVLDISSSFEDGITSLRPGEVSQPIETRRGYQIVVLVDHHDERQLSYEEVRDRLLNELIATRRSQRQAELVDRLRVEDPLELDVAAFMSDDPDVVVLTGRDLAMTRSELQRLEPGSTMALRQALETRSPGWQDQIDGVLQEEWLVRHGKAAGLESDPEFVARWNGLRYRTIVDHVFERTYAEWLSQQQREQLMAFYDDNRHRFTTPRQLHLSALFLRHSSRDRYATFQLAEQLLQQLQAGAPLAPLVARHSDLPGPNGNGDFGWNTHKQIAARGKIFYDAVLAATPGVWFGPVNWEHGYAVGRVEAIREPEPLEFDEAEPQVRRAFTRRMAKQHREELVSQVFEARHGELNESYFEELP
jgi:parvulin-like peptidyl-prolyl isomerase